MIEPTNRNIRKYQNDIVPAKKTSIYSYSRNQEDTVLLYGVVLFCCPLTWSYDGQTGEIPVLVQPTSFGYVISPLPGILEGHLTHAGHFDLPKRIRATHLLTFSLVSFSYMNHGMQRGSMVCFKWMYVSFLYIFVHHGPKHRSELTSASG